MTDYYAVLALNRDVDLQAIQQAYRDLALKWHPLRCEDEKAQECFDEISEAFQVLSNFELRALYDKFGMVGLKQGVPDGQGGLLGGDYKYEEDALDIFEDFFGTSNPYASIVEAAGAGISKSEKAAVTKVQTVYIEVPLENFYMGSTMTWKVGDRSLSASLKHEYTTGSTLRFKDDGSGSGEVRIVMEEGKHARFKRAGDDLHHVASISVLDALVGCSVDITAIDERKFSVPVSEVVHPSYTQRVVGEGMPKSSGGRGDLILSFDVKYPSSLRPDQKVLLKTGLAMPRTLSAAQEQALTRVRNAFGQ